LASLSIAFIDMPMTFVLQWQTYPTTPNPGAVAGYSLGIFILLLFLGALALERWQIYLTGAAAVALEGALQWLAQISVGAIVSTVILIGMASAVCVYANRRILQLIARVVADLRALREAEDAQRRVEKLAAIGQLAASIGHDLRNPLASIKTSFFVVKRRMDKAGLTADAGVGEAAQIVDREIEVCARILSELLDYARERPPQRQPVGVRELVQDAVRIVPPNQAVEVRNEVPEGLAPASVDRDQFRQVLANLIQNAVEAVAEKPSGTVRIEAEAASDEVRIIIADDGPGIAPAHLKRIFEPLFTTKKKGTGLGLAIVATIVERHGGRVEAQSDLGRGSRFTVRLPIASRP
jgi:signal transduction histidine kinase